MATDTDLSLLSLSSSLSPISTTPVQEEKPDVVALSDEESEAEEWMLQGQQSDYARCSYDQFGACRQQVFVCRTCRDQYDRLLQLLHPDWTAHQIQQQFDIGVLCEQCAHFCHENKGHDVVALGVKNHVACDCGNALFRRLDQLAVIANPSLASLPAEEIPSFHRCSLYPEKECLNGAACYNHNMRERWCYCDGPEALPMVQCVRCCDWFHNACAAKRYREDHDGKEIDLEDESVDYVCAVCEKGGESGEVEVKTKPVEEEKEEVEKEEGLEAMIRVGVNGENEG